ncbi:5-oxoprolinase subunit PxpB [Sinomicrobium oceani]|nr:5-oxoprolinase subunit PxpB [Sinomicrobium oceani]
MAATLNNYRLNYKPMGEKAILVEWPERIDETVLEDVLRFRHIIREKYGNACELVPAYHSLLVIFRKLSDTDKEIKILRSLYPERKHKSLKRRLWYIPVCYEAGFGLDTDTLISEKGLTAETLISLHTGAEYTVYAIGFLPGFMYLGGLDPGLYAPRREEPRLKVPKGAVGIGGKQTGIYPQESPGGWNIIGNSPIPLFDVSAKKPCRIRVGDKVKFFPVRKAEYDLIAIETATGVYKIKKEEWHD